MFRMIYILSKAFTIEYINIYILMYIYTNIIIGEVGMEEKILQSNPLLEALG